MNLNLHPLFISLAAGDRVIKIQLDLVYLKTLSFDEIYQEIDELFARHPKWMSKSRKAYVFKLMAKSNSIKELVSIGLAHGNPL